MAVVGCRADTDVVAHNAASLSVAGAAAQACLHTVVSVALAIALTLLGAGCSDEAGPSPWPSSPRGTGAVEQIAQSAQHAIHAKAEQPVVCEGCHELLAGEYLRARSWRCENCHPEAELGVHATAGASSGARECWSCHDFVSESELPTACASCHDRALGPLSAIRPHDRNDSDEDCGGCHRAHQTPSLATSECESCHDTEQVSGHEEPDLGGLGCASCHGYHEPASTAAGRCTGCHRQSRAPVSMNATFKEGHESCVTCHRPHSFLAPEVIGCRAECHERVVVLSARRVVEHRGCLGCHDKHDLHGSPREACIECHSAVVVKHPADRESGAVCIGCHPPHQGVWLRRPVACSSCHNTATDRALHQGSAQLGPACSSCHRPHRFALKLAGVALCRTCHGRTPAENAPAILTHPDHSDCMSCHGDRVAHTPVGPRLACRSCHEQNSAVAHDKHQDCIACHDPHTTRQHKPCVGCHQDQADAALAKHKNCVGCHEPHSTAQKNTCRGCHPGQAGTAPRKHRDCKQCHDRHSVRVVKQCRQCHQDRTGGNHAAVREGCLGCHRAHGPGGVASPPSCISCHQHPLPALHASSGHDDCESCHRSHGSQGKQLYRRAATCLACHTELNDHEPTAATCIGCHVFGGYQ